MALRRELLPLLLAAAFLLLGPAQALAAPTWLPAKPQPSSFPSFAAPAVATDADGNSVAVWIDQDAPDEVRAVYRPRGGAWQETPENLEPAFPLEDEVTPRATALTNGAFVVVWIANRNDDSDPVLRSATRSPSGVWTTEDVRDLDCCTFLINGLEAGGDGSVTVVAQGVNGISASNTKPSSGAPWGGTQAIGLGSVADVDAAPDGSLVAVSTGVCSELPCIRASYRPPGGSWGGQESAAITDGTSVTGLAVTANPGSAYTLAWGALTGESEPVIPGDVRSANRPAGAGQAWGGPQPVAHLEFDQPGSVDVASGSDGRQLVVWQQSGGSGDQIAGALRGAAGGAWGAAETVSGTKRGNGAPHAVFTSTLVPTVAWSSNFDNSADGNGAYRDGAGNWQQTLLGSSQDDSVALDDLDADGDGNALTAFRHRGGIFTVGFDAGGPRFTALSLPTGGSVNFSAAAADNWAGLASISWLFGDGTGASGAAVSHAYGAPGTYTATAIATDAVGNATQQGGPVTVTQTPPPPDPCGTADSDRDGIKNGCDDSNGAARPRAFKTVNATVVSGDVFVKLPRGSAGSAQAKPPKGFVRLQGAETIPVGATLDTRRGRVKVRSAATTGRKTQTGQFFRGRFLIRQTRIRKRSKSLITDMRLTGSSFRSACGANRASVSQTRRRSKKRVRRLFGNAKGRFRTSGRNAAATVRGTRWSVQDRCDGTLVKVQSGRVAVRDKTKRKTVIVRTGKRYLARAR